MAFSVIFFGGALAFFVLVFMEKHHFQKEVRNRLNAASEEPAPKETGGKATPEPPAMTPVLRVPPKVGTAPRHVFTDKAQFLVHDLEGGETLLEEISQGRVVTSKVHRKVADEVIREIIDLAVPIPFCKATGNRQPATQAAMPTVLCKPMAVRVQKRISGPTTATAA